MEKLKLTFKNSKNSKFYLLCTEKNKIQDKNKYYKRKNCETKNSSILSSI